MDSHPCGCHTEQQHSSHDPAIILFCMWMTDISWPFYYQHFSSSLCSQVNLWAGWKLNLQILHCRSPMYSTWDCRRNKTWVIRFSTVCNPQYRIHWCVNFEGYTLVRCFSLCDGSFLKITSLTHNCSVCLSNRIYAYIYGHASTEHPQSFDSHRYACCAPQAENFVDIRKTRFSARLCNTILPINACTLGGNAKNHFFSSICIHCSANRQNLRIAEPRLALLYVSIQRAFDV